MFGLNTTRETMVLFLKPFCPNPKAKQTIITLQNQHQGKSSFDFEKGQIET